MVRKVLGACCGGGGRTGKLKLSKKNVEKWLTLCNKGHQFVWVLSHAWLSKICLFSYWKLPETYMIMIGL